MGQIPLSPVPHRRIPHHGTSLPGIVFFAARRLWLRERGLGSQSWDKGSCETCKSDQSSSFSISLSYCWLAEGVLWAGDGGAQDSSRHGPPPWAMLESPTTVIPLPELTQQLPVALLLLHVQGVPVVHGGLVGDGAQVLHAEAAEPPSQRVLALWGTHRRDGSEPHRANPKAPGHPNVGPDTNSPGRCNPTGQGSAPRDPSPDTPTTEATHAGVAVSSRDPWARSILREAEQPAPFLVPWRPPGPRPWLPC